MEMPLEAVALPAVIASGSIWTCLAIIAAAVGLWRIRTVGFRSEASSSLLTSFPPSPSPSPGLSKPVIELPILRRFELDDPPSPSHREEVGTPKVRFTAYYYVDDDDDDQDHEESEAHGAVGDGVNGDNQKRLAKPWEGVVPKWEVSVLSGNGDLGWYRYQDMTALNGSVVKLWDRNGGLTASPRRRDIMGIYQKTIRRRDIMGIYQKTI